MKGILVKSAVLLLVSVMALNTCVIGKAQAQVALGVKVAGNTTNYMKFTTLDLGMEAGVFLRLGNKFFFQPE